MGFYYVLNWIYDHETLVAGMLGVGAASVSVYMLNKQIKQHQAFRETDRKARLYAAKAVLPLALNHLYDYGQQCLRLAITMCEGREVQTELPILNLQHMDVCKECIEFADDENRKKLEELVQIYQIQNARLKGWFDEYQPEDCPENRRHKFADKRACFGQEGMSMTSTLDLLLLTDDLWSFARSGIYAEPEASQKVESRLKRAKFYLLHYSKTFWVADINEWPKFLAVYEKHLNVTGDTHTSP